MLKAGKALSETDQIVPNRLVCGHLIGVPEPKVLAVPFRSRGTHLPYLSVM